MPSISVPGAIIGSAALGAGTSLIGGSMASSAAGKAADAQAQAAQAATAEQQREFDYIQANNAPFRDIGLSATRAVASGFGLPVSMTGSTPVASTPVASPGGVSMTGSPGVYGDRAIGVPGGLGPALKDSASATPTMTPVASPVATAVTPSASPVPGQVDYAQVLRDRPDILTAYNTAVNGDPSRGIPAADRNSPVFNQKGLGSPEAYAAYWYNNMRNPADYTYQPPAQTPATTPTTTPAAGGPPPGYTDPTAPGGYTMTGRPDPGAAPAHYVAPTLNVGLDAYQQSPDYNFRLSEGQKALDHLAAAGGGLMSGARDKALTRYNQDYATTDYNNWRDYTTSQFNNNRSFGYNQYEGDLSQYNTDRSRSDGLYQDDRSNLNSRYDTRNNTLLQLAGFGTSATASDNSAASSFATNVGNNLMTAGNARANGYINSSNAINQGLQGFGSSLAGGAGMLAMTRSPAGYMANGGYGGAFAADPMYGLY